MMLLFLACQPQTPQTPTVSLTVQEDDAAYEPLTAPRLLRRMSLDLRGVLPDPADLDVVEADASALSAIRDRYLQDPLLEQRLVPLLAERWHTEVDSFLINYWRYPQLGTASSVAYPFVSSIGQEPLRLMAYIATHDRSWDEVVNADYSMANEMLGNLWPLDYPEGGSGWLPVHYTDGRPAAGVLATNGLWWRYYTTVSNFNRGRASTIAALLLCVDYLSRPVSFSQNVSLTDTSGLEEALHNNPYCMGCHSSLDPLASSLFGFWAREYSTVEMEHYHAERELMGADMLGVSPAWYGIPMQGLADMGGLIADDPRYARCTAQSFAELLWRRSAVEADQARVDALQSAWEAGDRRIPPLLKAITDSPVYQAGGLNDQASPDQVERENTLRLMTAPLLQSSIEALTGFHWSMNEYDQMNNDTFGYRGLAGGVDGTLITRPQRTPSLTWAMVLERYTEAASRYRSEQDLAGTPLLLEGITNNTLSTDPAFSSLMDALYWRLYAQRPEADWQQNIRLLWEQVKTGEGTTAAWSAVLSVMLQDPLYVGY